MSLPETAPDAESVYEKAEAYWQSASADVDGMLGGFAHLHTPDIKQSKVFLHALKTKRHLMHNEYALDCGAGIGRVTKHLLIPMFKKVDMEDVVDDFLAKSSEYIGPESRVGERFSEGLQVFAPPEGRYDLIWIQWCSGYLTNEDFVEFFKRCKIGLRPGGCIVLKDNMTSADKADFDAEDNSWTRTESELLELFAMSDLKVVYTKAQNGMPKGMYPVKMFALK